MRFFYPPTLPWNFLFQRPQQLALALAERGHQFVFAEHEQDPKAPRRYETVASGVQVLHYDFAQDLRAHPETIVLASWAKYHGLARAARLLVFDSLDDFPAWREMERAMVPAADLVLCTSDRIARRTRHRHDHVVMVPNGVDPRPFARDWGGPVPPALAAIPRPRVVFSGCVGKWVDLELWKAVARATPDLHHVVVGKVWDRSAHAGLLDAPNVHLIPMVPHDELVRILLASDVGIIPFRRNDVTEAADPIKLYEYLAAGLPVVSTSIPEVRKLLPYVALADTAPAFCAALRQALQHGDDAARRERHRAIRDHSWARRAEAIERAVCDALERRGRPV